MRAQALLLALCLAPVGCLVSGCGADPTGPTMEPGQPIRGLNLTGKWYSREFGDMQLRQNQNVITGTYEDPRGPDHNGRIRGRLNADVLEMEWIKPGNPVAAIMPMRGEAKLRISNGGCSLGGLWGYDKSWHNGGEWNAVKSQFSVGGEHCRKVDAERKAPLPNPSDVPIDGTTEESLREGPGLPPPIPEGVDPGGP